MAALSSYGPWALVTGASAGIGVAFARAPWRQRASTWRSRLGARIVWRALAAELEPAVRTRVVPLDLAAEGAPRSLADAVGVDVLAVSPGPVETEFQAVAAETPHAGAKPEEVVRVAFAALGRKPSVVVGSGNKIRAWSVRLAPRAFVAHLAERVMQGNVPAEARNDVR